MKKVFGSVVFALALSGCASHEQPVDYRAGDYVIIYQAFGKPNNVVSRAAAMCNTKPYRMASYPKTIRPVRSTYFYPNVFSCAKEAALEYGSAEAQADLIEETGEMD